MNSSINRCFVTNSWNGVLQEGAISAALTALMILLFLGRGARLLLLLSFLRSRLPYSARSSSLFLGHTLNTNDSRRVALAVGINTGR